MPDSNDSSDKRTRVGYSVPHKPENESHGWDDATNVESGRAFKLDEFAGGALGRGPGPNAPVPVAPSAPAVEITFVHEPSNPPNARSGKWCAVEVWTQNRVYKLDSTMTCIEVVSRATNQPELSHSLLGARLTGGQMREGTTLEISHPFPVPGSDAMFQHPPKNRVRFGQTSRVERVVVRVRISTVALADAEAAWEEITGQSRKA